MFYINHYKINFNLVSESNCCVYLCVCWSCFKSCINCNTEIASVRDITNPHYLWYEAQKKYKNQVSFFICIAKKKHSLVSFDRVKQVGYCKVKPYKNETKPPKKQTKSGRHNSGAGRTCNVRS